MLIKVMFFQNILFHKIPLYDPFKYLAWLNAKEFNQTFTEPNIKTLCLFQYSIPYSFLVVKVDSLVSTIN